MNQKTHPSIATNHSQTSTNESTCDSLVHNRFRDIVTPQVFSKTIQRKLADMKYHDLNDREGFLYLMDEEGAMLDSDITLMYGLGDDIPKVEIINAHQLTLACVRSLMITQKYHPPNENHEECVDCYYTKRPMLKTRFPCPESHRIFPFIARVYCTFNDFDECKKILLKRLKLNRHQTKKQPIQKKEYEERYLQRKLWGLNVKETVMNRNLDFDI